MDHSYRRDFCKSVVWLIFLVISRLFRPFKGAELRNSAKLEIYKMPVKLRET